MMAGLWLQIIKEGIFLPKAWSDKPGQTVFHSPPLFMVFPRVGFQGYQPLREKRVLSVLC